MGWRLAARGIRRPPDIRVSIWRDGTELESLATRALLHDTTEQKSRKGNPATYDSLHSLRFSTQYRNQNRVLNKPQLDENSIQLERIGTSGIRGVAYSVRCV